MTDSESFRVTVNIYDTLVKHNSDGSAILPSLAEEWQSSESGRIWHFRIQKGLLFHDGQPLNAHAIAFNFNRWMDNDNPYHTGNFNYWNMSFEGFPGIVEQVTALSDTLLEIRLKEPFAPFLGTLAQPAFGIASPEAIKTYNDSLSSHPLGSGPFIFESWNNNEIVLSKNKEYWGDIAKVDQIVFKTISSEQKRVRMLEEGHLHIADVSPNVNDGFGSNSNKIMLSSSPSFNIGYLAFNMEHPILKHKDVRVAISHLIDKPKMMEVAYDLTSKPANTYVPPVLWGHNEAIKPIEYDPDLAKALLSPYLSKDQPTLDLLVMDSPRKYFPKPVELGEFIKESLETAGIKVNLNIQPWKDVIETRQSGDYDMILAGWNGDSIDPDNFLFTLFSSHNLNSNLSHNYSKYSNETVDKLLVQARQTLDRDFRTKKIYRDIQELIHEDTPAVPLAHTAPMTATQGIIGFEPSLTYLSGDDALTAIDLENAYE